MSAIHVDGVSKWYGDFKAVDDLSFEVRPGELFAMLGPNGSGKTTTIRMILDILKPDHGTISVLGGPMTDSKKALIGYLPEERGLYRNAKLLDTMVYLGTLKGLSRRDARLGSLALLEKLGLDEHAKSKVRELSKGMQQKVQFAVTVLHHPELVIIDEPFSGLDPVNTQVIKGLIREIAAAGTAIVMSTHQMHQVEAMADRMLMISRGKQKLYGEVRSVRSRYAPHAVVVEGQGDWAALPGVERVEHDANGRHQTTLYLDEAATTDDVLGAIAASDAVQITRFERAVPSLEEIFIRVAEEPDA